MGLLEEMKLRSMGLVRSFMTRLDATVACR